MAFDQGRRTELNPSSRTSRAIVAILWQLRPPGMKSAASPPYQLTLASFTR